MRARVVRDGDQKEKKTLSSFLLHVPKVYSLVTHKFLSQSSNTTRLPVLRTAEKETGRNRVGGGERVESVHVCQEKCAPKHMHNHICKVHVISFVKAHSSVWLQKAHVDGSH